MKVWAIFSASCGDNVFLSLEVLVIVLICVSRNRPESIVTVRFFTADLGEAWEPARSFDLTVCSWQLLGLEEGFLVRLTEYCDLWCQVQTSKDRNPF